MDRGAAVGQTGTQEAHERWAQEAYLVLVGIARSYHAVITYKELAEVIQERSGVRTQAPMRYWIGSVLGKVVREAHRRGDPPLTALVVHSGDGMVGEGYKEVLQVAGQPPVHDVLDRERHAAKARLDCYQRFGATLPPGGGEPALAPRYQATIDRRRSQIIEPPSVCPKCFVQLPATGVCDFCD